MIKKRRSIPKIKVIKREDIFPSNPDKNNDKSKFKLQEIKGILSPITENAESSPVAQVKP